MLHADCIRLRNLDGVVEAGTRYYVLNALRAAVARDEKAAGGADRGMAADIALDTTAASKGVIPGRHARAAAERTIVQEKIADLKHLYMQDRHDVSSVLQDAEMPHGLEAAAGDRRRSRGHRGNWRRHRSSSSMSRSGDRNSLEASDFRAAPSRGGSSASTQVLARPGENYLSAVREVSRHLGSRGGALGQAFEAQKYVTYLVPVFTGRRPPDMIQARTSTETRLVAGCLDASGAVYLPTMAGLLASRLKTLEASVSNGSWPTARHLDALADPCPGLATQDERQAAVHAQLLDHRLREAMEREGGVKKNVE